MTPRLAALLATVGGVGPLRPAPGTWGSLAAFPLAWVLYGLGGWPLLALAIAGAFALGVRATAVLTAGTDRADPSEIVLDEVVGQWIALMPVAVGASLMQTSPLALYPGLIAAFVAFRLFDIWKPGPVGWADRRHDPLGVMLDDVFAGVLAAAVVVGLAGLAHGLLM